MRPDPERRRNLANRPSQALRFLAVEGVSAEEKGAGARAWAWCLHHTRIQRRDETVYERNARLKRWPARLFAIALVGGAVAVGIGLYPNYVMVPKHPSLLDEIFQSRTIIVFVRVLMMFAAGFVVASLLARIWNRQWLSKAGPFEVSDVADLTADLDVADENLKEAEDNIATLNSRLAASDQTIKQLVEELNAELEERRHDQDTITSLQERVSASSSMISELLATIKRPEGLADTEGDA